MNEIGRVSATRLGAIGLAAFVLWTTALIAMACGAGGVRPHFLPFPTAVSDTVSGHPEDAIELAGELLVSDGLELEASSPVEGYLETKWFNIATGHRGNPGSLDTETTIRVRFWADLIAEHRTVVVGEVVRPRVVDPSLPIREREIPAPDGHPGSELLRRVFGEMRTRLSSGSASDHESVSRLGFRTSPR
ncbi:MAG: hypothetical protein AMS18_01840 [Gemmatimonas sp. SG8_17]|nr:MAG: hypothetical protein AMS18_01840 [Gemmatimonas sp. SG8_17]